MFSSVRFCAHSYGGATVLLNDGHAKAGQRTLVTNGFLRHVSTFPGLQPVTYLCDVAETVTVNLL